MLYLIEIHWTRRSPELGRPDSGRATYAEFAKTFTAARNKAVRKFNRHLGMHLSIQRVAEKQDPAGIFS
jgi:hypothetical protein